ncbi:MAG TPA: hypothetical protein VNN09_11150 [Candidatus Competibacteraceae bacterium]|nr:hypothetical protein [Candidatus Competibacteraceae bacterium]
MRMTPLGSAALLSILLTAPAFANGTAPSAKPARIEPAPARPATPLVTTTPPPVLPMTPPYTSLQQAQRLCAPHALSALHSRHAGIDRVQLVADPGYMLHGYAPARLERDSDGHGRLYGVGLYRDLRGWHYLRYDCRFRDGSAVRFDWQEEGTLTRMAADPLYRRH